MWSTSPALKLEVGIGGYPGWADRWKSRGSRPPHHLHKHEFCIMFEISMLDARNFFQKPFGLRWYSVWSANLRVAAISYVEVMLEVAGDDRDYESPRRGRRQSNGGRRRPERLLRPLFLPATIVVKHTQPFIWEQHHRSFLGQLSKNSSVLLWCLHSKHLSARPGRWIYSAAAFNPTSYTSSSPRLTTGGPEL